LFFVSHVEPQPTSCQYPIINYIYIFTKVSKACIGSIFVQFIIQVVVVQDCCCYDYDISSNYLVAYEIQWLHFCCQRIGINYYTPTGYFIAECIFLPTTLICYENILNYYELFKCSHGSRL
jgi:hypothetical protein